MFPGGKGEALYFLSLLDNADKQLTLTPILGVAKASLRSFGQTAIPKLGPLPSSAPQLASIGDIPEGGHVELHDDAQASPDIYFDDVQGFRRKAIIPALRKLSDVVSHTINTVADAFTSTESKLGPSVR